MLLLQNAVDELYTYMKQFGDLSDAEVLWRLARATCDKAKSTTDKTARKDLMYDAFKAAELALKLGDTNFACHKVFSLSEIINADCYFRLLVNWPILSLLHLGSRHRKLYVLHTMSMLLWG